MDAGIGGLEPGVLHAGKAVSLCLDTGDRIRDRTLAAEMLADLPITDAGHGGEIAAVARGIQATHFLDETSGDHGVHAGIDSRVQGRTIHAQAEDRRVVVGPILRLPFAKRAAGCERDFDGANEPARVVGIDAVGARGIDSAQLGKERRRAFGRGAGLEPCAEGTVGRDAGHSPAFEERPNVLAGATNDDGLATASPDVFQALLREIEVGGERERLVRVEDVEEMMRCGRLFSRVGLGSPDIHTAVDLPRVGVHDLAIEGAGECDAERGLASRGGANDGDEAPRRAAGHQP